MSAARRLPAGKISRKPRGRGAEGASAAPASLPQVGAAVTRGRREAPPRGLLSPFSDCCVSARRAAAPFRLPRCLRYLGEGAGGKSFDSVLLSPSCSLFPPESKTKPRGLHPTPPHLPLPAHPGSFQRGCGVAGSGVPEPQPPAPAPLAPLARTPPPLRPAQRAFHAASATLRAALQTGRIAFAHPRHQPIPAW